MAEGGSTGPSSESEYFIHPLYPSIMSWLESILVTPKQWWLSHTLVAGLSKFSRNEHLHSQHYLCQSDCWPISDVPAGSVCRTTMCPAIMVMVLMSTPCCSLTGKGLIPSLHTITVVNEVNSSLTEDTLSAVWLIKWPNVNNPGLNFLAAQLWRVCHSCDLCSAEACWRVKVQQFASTLVWFLII